MNFFRSARAFLEVFPSVSELVFTNGCFDVLHVGHVRYLNASRALGKFLVIGLNSDQSVKRLKGPGRPLNSEEDRAEVLLGLKSVDAVVLFDEETPYELIKAVQPLILTKGGDYSRHTIVGADIVESLGGKVVVIPFEQGYSTTGLVERMNHRNSKAGSGLSSSG